MKKVHFILSVIILATSAYLCGDVILQSKINQINRNDYAEINNIKWGLMNIDVWKNHIVAALIDEITRFDLTEKNEQDIKNKIRDVLNELINRAEGNIRKEYSSTRTGKIKLSVMNFFIDMDVIKKGIPEYADTIYKETVNAKTKSQIKQILTGEIIKFSKNTNDKHDRSHLNRIFSETGTNDIESARIKVNKKIDEINRIIYHESIAIIALTVFLFIISAVSWKSLGSFGFIFLIISLVLLLIPGVTTPMMNIEAIISSLTFKVMGHQINFSDQIIYFQSKSIINIFNAMIKRDDFMMKFLAVLMITFSIIIPVIKMLSSIFYYFNIFKTRKNPLIKFLVFKTGKWSMADVMAVAMCMTYMTFNGMINAQLSYMNWAAQKYDILTLNRSSLQPGIFLFIAYTILALFLTVLLERSGKKEKEPGNE